VVRLDIDRPGADGVHLEDCQRISRTLGRRLDDHEPISGQYVLEVSSPGADRPIRSDDDFRRNTGRRVMVETADAEGRRRSYRGTLLGYSDGELRLSGEEPDGLRIRLESVVSARQEIGF
jgi:ribosome maturation factor RimP